MFSGLNKFFKFILPKRLFYRALIIVAAPTIILQFIITIVFYDSIWIKANKNVTRSLVSQLKTIQDVYLNNKDNLDFFTDSYKNNFNFEIGIGHDVSRYYKKAVKIVDVQDLGDVMINQLTDLFTNKKDLH